VCSHKGTLFLSTAHNQHRRKSDLNTPFYGVENVVGLPDLLYGSAGIFPF
jgi:hypothetical protein